MSSIETFTWEQLARRQKIYIVAVALVLVAFIGYGIYDRFRLAGEIRESENAAIKAEREKDAALEEASKIAVQVKVREEELEKIEAKQNEKRGEVKSAGDDVTRARAEYERRVHERLTGGEVPSTDELCKRLAAAGHPCQPR